MIVQKYVLFAKDFGDFLEDLSLLVSILFQFDQQYTL